MTETPTPREIELTSALARAVGLLEGDAIGLQVRADTTEGLDRLAHAAYGIRTDAWRLRKTLDGGA